jgi:recombination protein RecT
VGYIGYYRLINGAEKTIYMSKKQIEQHERRNRKGQYMGKGWRDNWDAMALRPFTDSL